jgi:hypothetical protein
MVEKPPERGWIAWLAIASRFFHGAALIFSALAGDCD